MTSTLSVSGMAVGESSDSDVCPEISGIRPCDKIGSLGDVCPADGPAIVLSIARTGVTVTAGLT